MVADPLLETLVRGLMMTLKKIELDEIVSVNIGQPADGFQAYAAQCGDAFLTWWWLRRIGFRLAQAGVDNHPHMIAPVNRNMETALEVAPSLHRPGCFWTVWLRSDMAHSRCRFCYIRDVSTVRQLVTLMEAISGDRVQDVDFDADQFRDSLEREWRDCRRRYIEYANDARWGRVPGGL